MHSSNNRNHLPAATSSSSLPPTRIARWAGEVLLLFCLALLWGCADGQSQAPTFEDGGNEISCGPETGCQGCCIGNYCAPGTSPSACGMDGRACVLCSGDTICLEGQCTSTKTSCGAGNCPEGCCLDNTCQPGVSNAACGTGGALCLDCTQLGAVCGQSSRSCISECTPNCKGRCAGADDGCGGKCPVSDCPGCCLDSQCLPGTSDSACGQGNAACVNCQQSGLGSCVEGACDQCTPQCAGKCKGDSDSCGGRCPQNDCPGCCLGIVCAPGTTDEACGQEVEVCTNCLATGKSCEEGRCSDCTPGCGGKCQGDSDGCGGQCPTNLCAGCCNPDNNSCLPGEADTACGDSGEACQVCPADQDGYKWTCAGQSCIKDTPTGTSCSGQPDGTSCTDNLLPGICRDSSCCVGCYDGILDYCFVAINTSSADTCGIGGELCQDCTLQGQVCVGGKCSASSGSCAGKDDLNACSESGEQGVCVAGGCCTGCYSSDASGLKCTALPTDSKCGRGGAPCKACEAYENCEASSGSCLVDPASLWELRLYEVAISSTAERTWDPLAVGDYRKPDPYMGIKWDASCPATAPLDICTGDLQDTFYAQWRYSAGIFTADELTRPFCALIQDADGLSGCDSGDDIIGRCAITLSPEDLQKGYRYIWDCANPDDGIDYVIYIYIELIPTFTI